VSFSQDRPISLQECLSVAIQNNPDIRLSVEDESKALADYQYIKAIDRLQVVGALQGQDKETIKVGSIGTYSLFAGLIASYPLARPGQGSREDIARRGLDIAKINEKKMKDSVVLLVKSSYYGCIAAKKYTDLRERIKKNYEHRLLSVKGLVRTGDRLILDQSMAEVSLSQATLEFQKARNQELIIKSELKASMGLQPDSSDITVEDYPDLSFLKYGIDEINNFIDQYCPDVLTARVQTEMARDKIWMIRALHLPTVDLQMAWGIENDSIDSKAVRYRDVMDSKNWGSVIHFGVTAKVSIFNGGSINAQTDSAIAEHKKAIYYESKVILQMRKNARNFVNKLNELRDQIEISRLNIENSRINMNLAQRSYDSGIGNQLIVQNAEMSLLQAEMSLIEAKQNYFTVMAQLANMIGIEENELCGTK
jgi:outer membrane protein TolC